MGSLIDDILNQASQAAIQFIGTKTNGMFTPSSFELSSELSEIDSTTFDSVDAANMAVVGASGLGLAATAGIIAVATGIQKQLTTIKGRLDTALFRLDAIDKKIDKLLTITKRIDLKVQESHLREAMKHVIRSAVTETGIDLQALAQIGDDIESLVESVDGGLPGNSSIKLSSDVRAYLEAIYSIFSASRIACSIAYNRSHSAEPRPLVQLDAPENMYFDCDIDRVAITAVLMNTMIRKQFELRDECIDFIGSRFSFCDDDDKNEMNQTFLRFIEENKVLMGLDKEIEAFENLPNEAFVDDFEDTVENITSYLKAWVWKTDAGLLRRIQVEMHIYRLGYESLIDNRLPSDGLSDNVNIVLPFRLQ